MTIKKFQGKTKEEAIALAKEEMGASVVIMNVKEVRQKGFLGIFKGSMYEVTAALEDDVMPQPSFSIPPAPSDRHPMALMPLQMRRSPYAIWKVRKRLTIVWRHQRQVCVQQRQNRFKKTCPVIPWH